MQRTGVSIDSRTVKPGEVFVALKGPLHDGHNFVANALDAGAASAIVDHTPANIAPSAPLMVVPDTLEALRDLGKIAREKTDAQIIAITGSFGKTSTKEALAMVLGEQAKTFATPRSFNNHWGVPVSLANLPQDAQYGVLELGMNHAGEIEDYSLLVRPHVALITTVGEMHIGNFDSPEAVAKAKAEIFAGMDDRGTVVLNKDNQYYDLLASAAGNKKIISFGESGDVYARSVESVPTGTKITADVCGTIVDYYIPVIGKHWVSNSLAVLAGVHALSADVGPAAEKLRDLKLVEGRGAQHTVAFNGSNIHVIDESYNGGPASMRAAIEVLGNSRDGRKIAALGDMLELGEKEEQHHRDLAQVLIDHGVDLVFTSGPKMQWLRDSLPSSMRGAHDDDPEKLAPLVCDALQPGDTIMVKGSRGRYFSRGRMYAVVQSLLDLAR